MADIIRLDQKFQNQKTQSQDNKQNATNSIRQLRHNLNTKVLTAGFAQDIIQGMTDYAKNKAEKIGLDFENFTNAVGQKAPTSISRGRNARFSGVFSL